MPGTSSEPPLKRADARRSQRVLLRIPIQVKGLPEDGIPITEDTTTVEVNAHGAQDCRVVHIKEIHDVKNEVGMAFSFPNPKFWNIEFPPEDWKPYEV